MNNFSLKRLKRVKATKTGLDSDILTNYRLVSNLTKKNH